MANLATQKKLLIIAGLLLAIKFALIPLFAWQGDQIARFQVKSMRLDKVSLVLANQSTYTESVARFKAEMFEDAERFYEDNARTKLTIQTDIEEIFKSNQLAVEGFDWIIDSAQPVRLLRATVRFSGATENMIRSFWDMAKLPMWARLVESNQQIKEYGDKNLGMTRGVITLEFYAIGDEYFDPDLEGQPDTAATMTAAGGF